MKKRWIAGILATALLMTGEVSVYAAENQQSGTTTVTAKVDSTYTLSIPEDTDLSFGEVDTLIGELSVTGNIGTKQKVQVTVGKTDFVDEKDAANKFSFDLLHNGTAFSEQTWDSDDVWAAEAVKYPLTVHIPQETWNATKAGSYKATLTFQAELQ